MTNQSSQAPEPVRPPTPPPTAGETTKKAIRIPLPVLISRTSLTVYRHGNACVSFDRAHRSLTACRSVYEWTD